MREKRNSKSSGPRNERLNEILAECIRKIEAGERLDRDHLIEQHPDLAEDLRAFLSIGDSGNGPTDEAVDRTIRADKTPQDMTGIPSEGLQTLATDVTLLPGELPMKGGSADSGFRDFGDYELLEEIARGGMGVVYRARQLKLNRIVALKMILAGRLASEKDVQRFYKEAEAAAKLDHPGIIPIIEVGEHEGQHYFSMAFVSGPSLAKKLSERPFPPADAAELLIKLASAVQYAHEHGVIHRDLKPANVLLDDSGQPRITDFGLAKQLKADSDLTGTGQILGTPSYMPPEQAAGQMEKIGPASDVYSLGAVLYCLLTGRPPFKAERPLETLRQVLEQEPLPPRQLNGSIPRDLNTICMKCLEKDPPRRYRSATELGDDLQRFLNNEQILARPLSVMGRLHRWTKQRPVMTAGMSFAIGVTMLTAAIISAVISVTLMGSMGYQFFEDRERPDMTFPVKVGRAQKTPTFSLNAGELTALDMKMRIQTSSYQVITDELEVDAEEIELEEDTPVEAKYNFPVSFSILDGNGERVHTESSRVVWNASLLRNEGYKFDPKNGFVTLNAIASIGKFRVPATGEFTIEVSVEPDPLYEAKADSAEIRVHENVQDSKWMSISAGALCCGSPLLLIVGFGLLLYGPFLLMIRPKRTQRKAIL